MKTKVLALILSGVSFSSYAYSCATIKLSSADPANIVELVSANDARVLDKLKSRRIDKGLRGEYQLPEGTFLLSLAEWDKNYYRDLSPTDYMGRQVYVDSEGKIASVEQNSLSHMLEVNIQNDKVYEFKLSGEGSKRIELVAVSNKACDKDSSFVDGTPKSTSSTPLTLPNSLLSKLRTVMFDIDLYHLSNNLSASNIVQSKTTRITGLAIDKKHSGSGVKVLAVQPNSIGSSLNLQAGDVITKVGAKDTKINSVAELYGYIGELYFGETAEFGINRNGENIKHKVNYEPRVLPEFKYVFDGANKDLVNHNKLPSHLNARLTMVMLEIEQHIENKGMSPNSVIISAPAAYDGSLGMKASVEKVGDHFALVVSYVDPSGLSENIGLEVGDKLVSINGHDFTSQKFTELDEQFRLLNIGAKFNYAVIRNGKKKTLTTTYKPRKFPKFELSLNFEQAEATKDLLVKSSASMKLLKEYDTNKVNVKDLTTLKTEQAMSAQSALDSKASGN